MRISHTGSHRYTMSRKSVIPHKITDVISEYCQIRIQYIRWTDQIACLVRLSFSTASMTSHHHCSTESDAPV